MEDWEYWRYLYRDFINASISEPKRAGIWEHGKNKYEEYDQKIDLLSEISSDSISYTEVSDIILEMILLTFNYTHGQSLTHSEFSGNHTYIASAILSIRIVIQ